MLTDLFIDGTPVPAARRFEVENPATGAVVATVSDATAADALRALDAACASSWASVPPRERGEILRRAYELMVERADELAELASLELGRPIAESRAEVAYAAEFLRWFAEEAVRITGDYRLAPSGDYRIVVTAEPVGPCYLITPWNFPLAMVTRKIGPALAAGCTVVLKPAEATPLCALALADLLAAAGVPAGAVNVLPCSSPVEVTAALLGDGRLRKLSFTGSTAVGKTLLRQSADGVLRTSMELGGNAPFLVLADASVPDAIEGALVAKMRNSGQSCVAANRFLVYESVAAEFTEGLVARMAALTEYGPLVSAAARERVHGLVGRYSGKVLLGGEIPDGPGYFYPPTVIADAPPVDEEIFGPVAPITVFSDEDAMIEAANATPAGLVAFVYTRSRGLQVADALQAGMVGINRGLVSNPAAPFGGIKESGLGREGGFEGIHEYLEVKYLALGS
ncbi:NAD-dependent succinate-semialdehyde dehydrogenase [Thermopolyspora sp. NPDC052614]|uniref:NAD-dependent succinate-semialdehyde dehydrogenase n=1 Tax=Thermopolyspora sp. NPDC052614 TaxID=3155682 RepID=UPI00342E06D8